MLKIISIFFISMKIYSQPLVFSKNYFRWPVSNKPVIVANFGELRSGHWHMGLDVRTDQKVNMPVYAAADGYIARISVRAFGFGQAIYINHPNGLTTVYGHLNKFFPKLDSFVREEQYNRQSWEIEIDLNKEDFPVRKGQFIALSGSTGASQGPHVHFEIRNTQTERCINPMLFDFPIPDVVPPVITKLAMYNRGLTEYEQNPTLFPVKKFKGKYVLKKDTVIRTGLSKLGFAIGAYDCVSGSPNPNGIYGARIYLDKQLVNEFFLDSMDYEETGYVNAHIDYRYRYHSGIYLQQLFKLPGDRGSAYKLNDNDGIITLNDTNVHSIKIEILDAKQNISLLQFKIQHNDHLATFINHPLDKYFAPNFVNVFEKNDFELYLPEEALYDSIQPIFFRNMYADKVNDISATFHFSDASIPVHGQINIRIKPTIRVPEVFKNKLVIQQADEGNTTYRKATWQKDWLAASFNEFGSYKAFIDSTPPAINEWKGVDTIDLSASENIVFFPRDNTAIKNFRVELDDQWLRFTNDKGAAWIYNFDERCPFGTHKLNVRVEDIVGNVLEKTWWFKRNELLHSNKKGSLNKKVTSKKK
ncbi:MAG TPA: M23 family metallopeptidase [Chitinophagaceae bacterium]|nr:M23 family metallopeptidase [Chitinophagaceae bacterium]